MSDDPELGAILWMTALGLGIAGAISLVVLVGWRVTACIFVLMWANNLERDNRP